MKKTPSLPNVKDVRENIMLLRKNMHRNRRAASFDFCYSYFYLNKGQLSKNMESSCMHLWSYLASWGMLRNSKLLNCSPAALEPLIVYFDEDISLWDVDVIHYNNEEKLKKITSAYSKIYEIMHQILGAIPSLKPNKEEPTITLVTKIMLGVYGNIPAFDQNFKAAFHHIFGGFNELRHLREDDLLNIYNFYNNYSSLLSKQIQPEIKLMNYEGQLLDIYYPIAKLVDMFGFCMGTKIIKK